MRFIIAYTCNNQAFGINYKCIINNGKCKLLITMVKKINAYKQMKQSTMWLVSDFTADD